MAAPPATMAALRDLAPRMPPSWRDVATLRGFAPAPGRAVLDRGAVHRTSPHLLRDRRSAPPPTRYSSTMRPLHRGGLGLLAALVAVFSLDCRSDSGTVPDRVLLLDAGFDATEVVDAAPDRHP